MAERGLAFGVRDLVAEEGQGEWDDGRGGRPGQEAQEDEQAERRRQRAGGDAEGKQDHRRGHHPELADPVAEGAVGELEQAVGEGVGGDGQPGAGDAGVEVAGEDGQQGVDDAGVGGDGEGQRPEQAEGHAGWARS